MERKLCWLRGENWSKQDRSMCGCHSSLTVVSWITHVQSRMVVQTRMSHTCSRDLDHIEGLMRLAFIWPAIAFKSSSCHQSFDFPLLPPLNVGSAPFGCMVASSSRSAPSLPFRRGASQPNTLERIQSCAEFLLRQICGGAKSGNLPIPTERIGDNATRQAPEPKVEPSRAESTPTEVMLLLQLILRLAPTPPETHLIRD